MRDTRSKIITIQGIFDACVRVSALESVKLREAESGRTMEMKSQVASVIPMVPVATMQIIEAHSIDRLKTIRQLFTEYVNGLEIELCFQNFKQELESLPGKYAPPDGRLLLALQDDQAVGCGALRKFEQGICEMKRLYVRPQFRGQRAGRKLAEALIEAARQIGYQRMVLDTLSSMKEAICLYESLSFCRTAPYYHNPSPRAVFMQLELS